MSVFSLLISQNLIWIVYFTPARADFVKIKSFSYRLTHTCISNLSRGGETNIFVMLAQLGHKFHWVALGRLWPHLQLWLHRYVFGWGYRLKISHIKFSWFFIKCISFEFWRTQRSWPILLILREHASLRRKLNTCINVHK